MTFIWPVMLWSLLLIPLFVGIYWLIQRRRLARAASFGGLAPTPQSSGRLGWRRHVPPTLFLLALSVLLFALARPQTTLSLPRVEGTVILDFDVSGSMSADDIKPTRMEAAKAAAREFVQHQPISVQIGVVAFSDSGLSVQPPTNDQAAILAAINRLAPARGTSIANGILASLTAIATSEAGQAPRFYTNLTPMPTPSPTPVPAGVHTSGVIVLLTDGENNERPDPLAAARAAADRGVRIYTVGLGSATGTTVHVNGFTVHTQLDEAALQQIAQLTDGTYYNAQTGQDLHKIYDTINKQLVIKPEKTEVTSIFAGSSILALLIGGMFSLLWFSRLP